VIRTPMVKPWGFFMIKWGDNLVITTAFTLVVIVTNRIVFGHVDMPMMFLIGGMFFSGMCLFDILWPDH
jgi:hypothetical protein